MNDTKARRASSLATTRSYRDVAWRHRIRDFEDSGPYLAFVHVADTLEEFDHALDRHGIERSQLDARSLLEIMAAWYRTHRYGDALPLDQDGDMLLVQWERRADPGYPVAFIYSVGRQVLTQSEDEGIWQLDVRLTFESSPPPDDVPNGHRWCTRPEDLVDFEASLATDPAWRAVVGRNPAGVEVSWEVAG